MPGKYAINKSAKLMLSFHSAARPSILFVQEELIKCPEGFFQCGFPRRIILCLERKTVLYLVNHKEELRRELSKEIR